MRYLNQISYITVSYILRRFSHDLVYSKKKPDLTSSMEPAPVISVAVDVTDLLHLTDKRWVGCQELQLMSDTHDASSSSSEPG